jgi:hypothetical protein
MGPREFRLRAGWFGPTLPGVRELPDVHATYALFSPDALPPLVEPHGTLDWLTPLDPRLDAEMAEFRRDAAERGHVDANLRSVLAAAGRAGLRLPRAFIRLMESRALQDRFPSVTACYFDLPRSIVRAPLTAGGHVVRFLNDQQGCLFWYLWLRTDGSDSVLCTDALLDDEASDEAAGDTGELIECAASFEAFLYRYWLEQRLWFALRDRRPLTRDQERYSAFYRSG